MDGSAGGGYGAVVLEVGATLVRGLGTQPGRLELSAEALRFVPDLVPASHLDSNPSPSPNRNRNPNPNPNPKPNPILYPDQVPASPAEGSKAVDEGGLSSWVRDGERERDAPVRPRAWLVRVSLGMKVRLRRSTLSITITLTRCGRACGWLGSGRGGEG